MNELPKSWEIVELGTACDVIRGITFPSSAKEESYNQSNVCCLRTSNIQREIDWGNIYFISHKYVKRDDQIVKLGDILMSMANSYELVGKISAVKEEPLYPSAFGAFLSAIRTKVGIEGQYLFHLLRTEKIQRELRQGSSQTVNIANISVKTLSRIEIPIAPLNEQRRIVAKLDSLFARSCLAREELERIGGLCDRYRQAVLAAACSGRLTADWRDSNKELENWNTVRLSEVATSRLGKMLDKSKNKGTPKSYLRNTNVRWFHFDLTDILEIKVTEDEVKTLSVKQGDVLICEGGEPGRCAIWRGLNDSYVYQKALHRVRVGNSITPEWICYCIKDATDSGRLLELFTGTTIKHLTGASLSQFELLLPPLEEQKEIVQRVEKLFNTIAQIEQQSQKALKLCDRLDQSILTKAFSGKLVPQDPTDESAEVLLDRIRSEKQDPPKAKRRR